MLGGKRSDFEAQTSLGNRAELVIGNERVGTFLRSIFFRRLRLFLLPQSLPPSTHMSSPKQQSSFDDEKGSSDVQLESAQEAGLMQEPSVKFSAEEEAKLYRRVDFRILPILALLVSLPFFLFVSR